jgi:dienelactone hydrolase
MSPGTQPDERTVSIPADEEAFEGDLIIPSGAGGLVLFAHGSGSSRFSKRNRQVASVLQEAGFATLMMDLLTPGEDKIDRVTREYRFDIPRLAGRVVQATSWARDQEDLAALPIGCFGASTGAAAALIAASQRDDIRAVVSRGGRPDLAAGALPKVRSPTLLIVGGNDAPVIDMNQDAQQKMTCDVELEIVPGATHLFEEPGALEEVSRLAREWFQEHLIIAKPV